MRPSGVLLVSGGLDSITLAYWLAVRAITIVPVFFDYGQHCATTELQSVRALLPRKYRKSVLAIRLGEIYDHCRSRMLDEADLWRDKVADDDLYVPYRNQLLLTAGAAIATSLGHNVVYSGFIHSDLATGDASTSFLKQLARLTHSFGGVQLKYPFSKMSKSMVARIGVKLRAPIAETYSCLMRSKTPCGACPNCRDRARALASVGIHS